MFTLKGKEGVDLNDLEMWCSHIVEEGKEGVGLNDLEVWCSHFKVIWGGKL